MSESRSPADERSLAALWPLDPKVIFLNHGSFGACPRVVLDHQSALRAELEAEPVRFLSRELDDRLDVARAALAAFLGADADDLAFVTNATSGVNAVLRSRVWSAGDELLTTDHVYRACRNALDYVAERTVALAWSSRRCRSRSGRRTRWWTRCWPRSRRGRGWPCSIT